MRVYTLEYILSKISGGAAVWGGITGTLSAQTDLQTALNAKLNASTFTSNEISAITSANSPSGANPFATMADLTVGSGDMTKAVYDIDNDGIVDDSAKLDGQNPAFYLARANHTGTQLAATISDFASAVAADEVDPVFNAWLSAVPYLSEFNNDVGYITDLSSFNTGNLTEGSNLYFTDERAQDAIGSMIDTTFDYSDATPRLSRAALTGAITASLGSNTTALGSFTKSQLDTAVSDGNVLYVGDVTSFSDEAAQDAVGAMIDTSLVYVDGTPLLTRAALTGAITASQGSNTTALGSFTKAQLDAAVSDGNVLYVGDVTSYTDEAVDDRVAALIQNGTGISWSYNDGANTLTPTIILASFSTSNLSEGSNLYYTDERAQDAVGLMIDSSLVYIDGTPLLTRAALTGDATASQGSNAVTVVKSSGAWSRTGEITPAQIVANTNDYAPTGFSTASVLYLDTDATRTLSGIAGGAAGREIEIVYIGANTLTILHNNAGSATGNKFSCLASFSLTAGCSASFHHDGTFWRLISWCGVFGGDLSGTFPNQVIGSGKVTTSKLADANVTEAKLLIADNTTADVSTSAHGFAPKAPNDTTKYLCGDATWTALRQIVMPTVTSTATTITFDSTYYGKVFLWSPSGTATATLPANGAAAGSWFEVWLLTNQTITITAATLDTLITVNDTAADSVAFSTTSLKIGSVVKFISTGSVWAAVNVGTNTMTIAT